MITSSMFTMFGGGPRTCPICGAANQTCTGPDPRASGSVILASVPRVGPVYRSREQVWETDPMTGYTILKYGIGTEIPLAEALRQGVATWDQLTPEQVAQMATHGIFPLKVEELVEQGTSVEEESPTPPHPTGDAHGGIMTDNVKTKRLKRPPKDKMVREGGTVTKGA